MKSLYKLAVALGAAVLLSVPAQAENVATDGGTGALAAISTLVYGPVKVVYAVGGLIFGGGAWLLSGGDDEILARVVNPAVRGDYVVTPEVIRGERPLEFLGKDPVYRDTVVDRTVSEDPRYEAPLYDERY